MTEDELRSAMMNNASWIDVAIFSLLLFWFILDRCNVYFRKRDDE